MATAAAAATAPGAKSTKSCSGNSGGNGGGRQGIGGCDNSVDLGIGTTVTWLGESHQNKTNKKKSGLNSQHSKVTGPGHKKGIIIHNKIKKIFPQTSYYLDTPHVNSVPV
jgi:hypothetical protein